MGKSHSYTDSETEETSCSSAASENVKKKNKFSILKYTTGNVKKKKCKAHSKPEPEEREYKEYKTTSQSSVKSKLQGILKHREKESSDEEDDSDPNCEPVNPYSQSRCLVGRVPRPAGAKPGRGGGVALIVKRNVSMPLHNASRVRFLLGTKEDDDSEPNSETNSEINSEPVSSQSRCLVGRVPRPVGARPGRSRGLALLVKKSKKPTAQDISTSSKIKSYNKSLSKKQSY